MCVVVPFFLVDFVTGTSVTRLQERVRELLEFLAAPAGDVSAKRCRGCGFPNWRAE